MSAWSIFTGPVTNALCYSVANVQFRAQTNTQIFGEYSNIRIFKYKISYSNIRFKGNIQHQYVEYA